MLWEVGSSIVMNKYSSEGFPGTNKLAHDLWYWQLSTAVHPLGDLIVVEI